jgi:hypothetical protein
MKNVQRSEAPRLQDGASREYFINNNQICITLFDKVEDPYREGSGEIL